jgi:hypothetical protein
MPIEMHKGCAQDVVPHEDEQYAADEQHGETHDVIPGIDCFFPTPAFPETPDQVDRRQAGDE